MMMMMMTALAAFLQELFWIQKPTILVNDLKFFVDL